MLVTLAQLLKSAPPTNNLGIFLKIQIFTGDQNFIKQLVNYDKDNMTDRILKKIGTYCAQPDFQPEIIGRVSLAAKSLCMWVRAMEVYGRIYRVVEPKKQRLAQATSQLQEKQAVLADAKAKLKEVGQKCLKLQGYNFGGCRGTHSTI